MKKRVTSDTKKSDLNSILSALSVKEKEKIVEILQNQLIDSIIPNLSKLSVKKKRNILDNLKKQLQDVNNIPLSVFQNNKLGSFENLTRYLKKTYSYAEIARLLKRDQRTIWTAYHNSLRKFPSKLKIKTSKINIPVSIFADRKLSILENLVSYLKDRDDLSYSRISNLIKRDYSTIVTVYNRAKKKNE